MLEKNDSQQTVLLGVTGSIAAYKACELLRLFQKAGVRVKVIMTEHAQELVGAATFRALSGEPVATDLFDAPGNPINHVSLGEEADIFVIAPCSANVLNKLANGIADDLLTTTALATKAPLVVAPAMNVNMLQNYHTQEALKVLAASGATIVGPGEGYLACGDEDSGRMSSPEEICDTTLAVLALGQSLAGKRVLITTGPTREFIDPVRYISSPSSGRTGFALAREAVARGAEVVLVSGPTELQSPSGLKYIPVVSALQMLDAASEHFDTADLAIFSAAVADFRPAQKAHHKLKKGTDLPAIPDMLDTLDTHNVETPLFDTYAHDDDSCLFREDSLSEWEEIPLEKRGAERKGGSAGADISREDSIQHALSNTQESGPRKKTPDDVSQASNLSEKEQLPQNNEKNRKAWAAPTASYNLRLTANPDILANLVARRNEAHAKKPYVIGFAAETEHIVANAKKKLESKGADLIIANDVSDPGIGFASSHNQITIVDAEGCTQTGVMSKENLAKYILDMVTPKVCAIDE